MIPKILVLEEDGWDRNLPDTLYKLTDRPTSELLKEFREDTKLNSYFSVWLVEKGYCADVPDEQIEYFYY